MSPGPSNVPISGSDTHSGMTLPAEQNGVPGEAVNGALSSESPDTAESMADNAGLSVPPVSPGGPESGKVPILHKTALTLVVMWLNRIHCICQICKNHFLMQYLIFQIMA